MDASCQCADVDNAAVDLGLAFEHIECADVRRRYEPFYTVADRIFIVLWFRRMLLQAVERQPETPEVLSKVRRIFNVAAAVLIGVLITAAAVDAGYGYYRSRGAETSALQK